MIVLVEVQHAVKTDGANHTRQAAFTGDFFQATTTHDTNRIDAVDGVKVQTELAWDFAQEFNFPCVIFINKLDRERADFYRAVVHSLEFVQGSPRKIIFDNLKAAVLSGSGRYACLHPEFLALCGHFCMEPIPCAARDPESKGIVEGGVRYVKRNALAGRSEELTTWEDYRCFAPQWRDKVANVRLHAATKERPIDRFQKEHQRLRPLPAMPFDTDEVLSVVVTPHARIHYEGNRYSVPPGLVRKPVMLRVSETEVRILDQGREVARHERCYQKGQLIIHPEDRLAALKRRRRRQADQREEEFDALGPVARQFHLKLLSMPVKPTVHLRRLLGLVRLYGTRRCWPPSARPSSTRPTTRPTSKPSCCNSAAAASFLRPRPCSRNAAN